MVKIGVTIDNQADVDGQERALLFNLWRILRGKQVEEVSIEDLKVAVLAILRMASENRRIGVEAPSNEEQFYILHVYHNIKEVAIYYIEGEMRVILQKELDVEKRKWGTKRKQEEDTIWQKMMGDFNG